MTRGRSIPVLHAVTTVVLLATGGALMWLHRSDVVQMVQLGGPDLLILAAVPTIMGTAVGGLAWYCVLRALGIHMSVLTAISLFLASQLGKYLPTGLGPLLAQLGWTRRMNISVSTTVSSYVLAYALSLSSGLTCAGALLLPSWPSSGVCLLTIGLMTSALLLTKWGRRQIDGLLNLSPRTAGFSIPSGGDWRLAYFFSLAGWSLIGVHVGALLHVSGLPANQLFAAPGAAIAAGVLGSAVFILPGGLGAREGLLFSYLITAVSPAKATTVVLLSRVLTLTVDLFLGILGILCIFVMALRRRRRPETQRSPTENGERVAA